MGDVISTMTGPQLIGLVAVAGGIISTTLVILVSIVVPLLSAARRAEALCQLKRDMVAAGFSVDDIERVVRAEPEAPALVGGNNRS